MTTHDPAYALADEWHLEASQLLFASSRKDTPPLTDDQERRLHFLLTLLSPNGNPEDARDA